VDLLRSSGYLFMLAENANGTVTGAFFWAEAWLVARTMLAARSRLRTEALIAEMRVV